MIEARRPLILVDTNVISELMPPAPSPNVLALLPGGRRRDRLIRAIDAMIAEDFADRVLPFDSDAAVAFAAIFLDRRAAGRPISFPDCQIAATARARGAAIATRNVGDFQGCGVPVIDPWDGA